MLKRKISVKLFVDGLTGLALFTKLEVELKYLKNLVTLGDYRARSLEVYVDEEQKENIVNAIINTVNSDKLYFIEFFKTTNDQLVVDFKRSQGDYQSPNVLKK